MKEWTKMINGELYDPSDPELKALRDFARSECFRFNHDPEESRIEILRKLFGHAGEGLKIHPNFQCDYGANIHVGDYFFANFDCIILDVCKVTIGDHCVLGPRVSIFTATHSPKPFERITGKELGDPITIGNNVWINGGSTILHGVTIGDNVIIGAGSVVREDVPSNTYVIGNPAQVVSSIP